MNRQLLFITVTMLSVYSGSQAAANNPFDSKKQCIAEYKPFEELSVAELNDKYAKVQALIDSKTTSWECQDLHARNCRISEIFLQNHADETTETNLAAEMQQNLVRMSNPLSPKESFELRSKMVRINERL